MTDLGGDGLFIRNESEVVIEGTSDSTTEFVFFDLA